MTLKNVEARLEDNSTKHAQVATVTPPSAMFVQVADFNQKFPSFKFPCSTIYTSFYNSFQALWIKHVAIEHALQLKTSQTLISLLSQGNCQNWEFAVCVHPELYDTESFVYGTELKKPTARFMTFAPLWHFVPNLFELSWWTCARKNWNSRKRRRSPSLHVQCKH